LIREPYEQAHLHRYTYPSREGAAGVYPAAAGGIEKKYHQLGQPEFDAPDLAFFGEYHEGTDRKDFERSAPALEPACILSFEIGLTGFGKFGSAQKPKVLWVGAAGGEDLAGLAATAEGIVRNVGFDGDERAFRPHLTLGRVKWLEEAQNLKKLLDDYHDVAFQRMMVKEVVFYESILRPAGPLYRPIRKFKLEG
jgi:2'-5' RNA ligase